MSADLFNFIISASLADANTFFSWPVIAGFSAVALRNNSVYFLNFLFLCYKVVVRGCTALLIIKLLLSLTSLELLEEYPLFLMTCHINFVDF